MDRFTYSNGDLQPNESYITCTSDVRLYDGDNRTSYEGGDLKLTSHRLLWNSPEDCRFLSLDLRFIIYNEEEKPSGFLFNKRQKLILYLEETSYPRNNGGPMSTSQFNHIKLSFRDKLDYSFISCLNKALEEKNWQNPTRKNLQRDNLPAVRSGIVGIERKLEEKLKATDERINEAFQDLNNLMAMARNMVDLSKNISNKIRERQGDISDDDTVKFKSYLMSLGIDDPVTRKAYSNELQYFHELCWQIIQIIEQPLTEAGGIMSLADAYCRVNRARGMELLSPEDFLSACALFHDMKGVPIISREFDSGVKVLQLASQSDEILVEDTKKLLDDNKYLTSEDLARILGISIIMAKERLIATEKIGKACRDESIEGLRFYPNKFIDDS